MPNKTTARSCYCLSLSYIFGHVPMVNICRCDLFGHVQIFRSYSFGHLESVKWVFLIWMMLNKILIHDFHLMLLQDLQDLVLSWRNLINLCTYFVLWHKKSKIYSMVDIFGVCYWQFSKSSVVKFSIQVAGPPTSIVSNHRTILYRSGKV